MTGRHRTLNTAQLKAEIDQGRRSDKVPFTDPAAALGTDDEAAGRPPEAARLNMGAPDNRGASEKTPPKPFSDERGRNISGELDGPGWRLLHASTRPLQRLSLSQAYWAILLFTGLASAVAATLSPI